MSTLRAVAISLAAGFPFLAAERTSAAGAERPVLAIEGVALVDVERGRIVPGRTVIIRHWRIAEIVETNAIKLPADAVRLDGGGTLPHAGSGGHARPRL